MKHRHAALLLVLLAACGKQDSLAPEAATKVVIPVTSAWSWHALGGLAVIEGEVGEPTELLLVGRSIKERRYAETGPVRWELFRPPEGEEAILRTADGRELARFTFATTVAPPRQVTARKYPESAVPLPRPTPEPPAPRVRAEAHLRNAPIQAIPERRSSSLPSTEVPDAKPRTESWWRKLLALPTPEAPAPKVHAEARFKNTPVVAIPERKSIAMPSASTAPDTLPARSTVSARILPEPVNTQPLKPAPPVLPGTTSTLWPGMGEALNLTRGPGGQKRLLLSFDGGSSAEVATEVLDMLKARNVHTTLFLTGAFIQRYPALVKRMAAEGHELGNHTMNHPHFAPSMKRDPKWTRERIQKELLDADAALVRLLGRPMDPYWRAPYGEHTAEIRRWAEELGYRHVGWSEGADTLDWATPKERKLYRSGEAIVQRLQQRLGRDGDGLIVLMHLGSARVEGDRPTDGLGAFMDRARKEGWTFVSAGTILRDLGKPAWDPHQRLALLNPSAAQAR